MPFIQYISLHFGVATGKLCDNFQQFLNIDVILSQNVSNMILKHKLSQWNIIVSKFLTFITFYFRTRVIPETFKTLEILYSTANRNNVWLTNQSSENVTLFLKTNIKFLNKIINALKYL